MSVRRGLMMGMAQGWKTRQVVAPSTVTIASNVKDWIDSLQIDASQAIVVRDDWTTMASGNGTLIVANIDNGVAGAYIRYYNNTYAGNNLWSSSYALSVDAGDSYTIFYK